jgi:small subunit ribosomal protein S13
MPRIAGVDIPPDKKIKISLRYIYGVGPTNALQLLKEAGIDPERRAKELSEEELAQIIGLIDKEMLVEGALRRSIQQNIARLRDIGSYRGNRHRRSLPVRGQRTRSNARTRKGPRKTVAGKKGVKELGK